MLTLAALQPARMHDLMMRRAQHMLEQHTAQVCPRIARFVWHKLQPASVRGSVQDSLTFAWPATTINVEQDLQQQTHGHTAWGDWEEAVVPSTTDLVPE